LALLDNFGITPDSSNAFQCQICKKATKTLQIGRSMKPEVMAYFRPPQQLIEESLKKIKAVMEFQSYHRNRLSKFQRDRLDKYQQRLLLEQERSAARVWEKLALFIMIETLHSTCLKLRNHLIFMEIVQVHECLA
jgi:hypothetical protein